MIVAVIGSRGLRVRDLARFLPRDTTAIVSGGAKGVDSDARSYARKHGLPLTEFLPDYRRYGQGAPLRRNLQIIETCDRVLAFWDGRSPGTRHVIEQCRLSGKPVTVWLWDPQRNDYQKTTGAFVP